ncbi:MAG: pyruvate kinase [Polyangia bacterium]
MRRAKIVCTLGPASSDASVIGQLIDEGMNVARINFSHGDQAGHAAVIATVRAEAKKRDRWVAVLQDLQGPKIRVGRFATGSIELEPGSDFLVTTRELMGDATRVSTTYLGLPHDVKPGDLLLLDDGLLALEVVEVDGQDVHTRVAIGGTLKNNKGINLPGVNVSAPPLTEKDIDDLRFGQRIGVDFVALSFVRSGDDIHRARLLIAECGGNKNTPIIAKIERPEAVEHLDEIIDVADGIMVARGDLGVELGAEKVPLIQKRCIEETNRKGKVVITATQMLESMITNQRPTRAEASDVANAVLDGTDAVMLSGETASGKYPLLAVRTMSRIVEEIESSQRWRTRMDEEAVLEFAFSTNAIAKGAVVAARQVGAKVVAVVSDSGGAARFVSEYRPDARIVAFSSLPGVCSQLALYWGVEPLLMPHSQGFDQLVEHVSTALVQKGIAKKDDLVVQTMAYPVGVGESTNTLHIHRLR